MLPADRHVNPAIPQTRVTVAIRKAVVLSVRATDHPERSLLTQ